MTASDHDRRERTLTLGAIAHRAASSLCARSLTIMQHSILAVRLRERRWGWLAGRARGSRALRAQGDGASRWAWALASTRLAPPMDGGDGVWVTRARGERRAPKVKRVARALSALVALLSAGLGVVAVAYGAPEPSSPDGERRVEPVASAGGEA